MCTRPIIQLDKEEETCREQSKEYCKYSLGSFYLSFFKFADILFELVFDFFFGNRGFDEFKPLQ